MSSHRHPLSYVSICLLAIPVSGANLSKPPKPNPADPVNYVEWINRTMGADLKENAAPVYREAYAKCVPFEGDLGDVTAGPWSGHPKVSRWLTANRDAMKQFRQAAAMHGCFLPLEDYKSTGDPRRDHILSFLLLPDLRSHRQLARALMAEGYQAWHKGDRKTLIANAVTVIRSGHHLDNTLIMIQRMVGTSCIVMGHDALRKAMSLSEKPDQSAQAVLVELRQVDPVRVPLSQALLGERLSVWDVCQRLLVPGKQAGTWSLYEPMVSGSPPSDLRSLIEEAEWTKFSKDLRKLPAVGFDATLSEVNACCDDIEQWSRRPYGKAAGEAERLNQRIKQNPNVIARTFVVNLTRVRVLDDHALAADRATRLAALILAHHGQTSQYPASLGELKAPDLKELRTDPFSGQDFVYRNQTVTFALYSVGENLKDDGGQHDQSWKAGDFVFWPVQKNAPAKPASK